MIGQKDRENFEMGCEATETMGAWWMLKKRISEAYKINTRNYPLFSVCTWCFSSIKRI
jgi:hypothetical protein